MPSDGGWRLAFTTVLAGWPGWTSDPAVMARVVTAYYPDRAAGLARYVELGWGHLGGDLEARRQAQGATDGRDELGDLVRSGGAWWLEELRWVTAVGLTHSSSQRAT